MIISKNMKYFMSDNILAILKFRQIGLILIFSILLSESGFAAGTTFYVSPNGNDASNGLSEIIGSNGKGPFKSLKRARDAVRQLKENLKIPVPIKIKISEGEYFLDGPLKLDHRDSGWDSFPVQWEGVGNVILNAGKKLESCTFAQNSRWLCATDHLNLFLIPQSKDHRIDKHIPPFSLYMNGKRLKLAQWPNAGWGFIKQPLNKNSRFTYFPAIPQLEKPSRTAVYIWPGNDWYDHYLPIETVSENTIALKGKTAYPLATGRRFRLLNDRALLDSNEEWYFDSLNKTVELLLPASAAVDRLEISYHRHLLKIDHSQNVTFRNLKLKNSSDTAIAIEKGKNIQLDRLTISQIEGAAVSATHSDTIQLTNSHIYDTGLGGVLFSGGDRKKLTASNNRVHNSHIHHIGQRLANYAPAIYLKGAGATATHNLIAYTPGLAILIEGNDHKIDKNEIHHICELASDCGAIYSGRDWSFRGNRIRHNHIHSLYGYGLKKFDPADGTPIYGSKGVRGVYLDDGASGFTIQGNHFENAGFISLQVGGGRDNSVENNLFITDQYAILMDNRWPGYKWDINRKRLAASPYKTSEWMSRYPTLAAPMPNDTWPEGNKISKNVIVATGKKTNTLRYFTPSTGNRFSENMVWSEEETIKIDYLIIDKNIKRGGVGWSEWVAEGLEIDNIPPLPCLSELKADLSACQPDALHEINFEQIHRENGLQPVD